MKSAFGSALLFSGLLVLIAGALPRTSEAKAPPLPEPRTVAHVDLQRYMGVWYEIARYPQRFQEGCVAVQATYALRDDGKVSVLNECRLNTLDGKLKQAKGVAKVADPTTNAKLRVSFFWPFYGDYWIFALGQDYEYAVVGAPDRESLWILSRTRQMDEALYNRLIDQIREQGFDPARLTRTLQHEN